MYRSTTDEMLAARFDPEPWRVDGLRFSTGDEAWDYADMVTAHGGLDAIYDPRPEFIPTRDPEPWFGWDQFRGGDVRNATPFGYATFDPRPEYARPEPNPILVELRKHWQPGFEEEEIQMALESTAGTPAQIDHARKVLTHLANVYKEA